MELLEIIIQKFITDEQEYDKKFKLFFDELNEHEKYECLKYIVRYDRIEFLKNTGDIDLGFNNFELVMVAIDFESKQCAEYIYITHKKDIDLNLYKCCSNFDNVMGHWFV
jgi:hypothetical protein